MIAKISRISHVPDLLATAFAFMIPAVYFWIFSIIQAPTLHSHTNTHSRQFWKATIPIFVYKLNAEVASVSLREVLSTYRSSVCVSFFTKQESKFPWGITEMTLIFFKDKKRVFDIELHALS